VPNIDTCVRVRAVLTTSLVIAFAHVARDSQVASARSPFLSAETDATTVRVPLGSTGVVFAYRQC